MINFNYSYEHLKTKGFLTILAGVKANRSRLPNITLKMNQNRLNDHRQS